MLLVVALTGIIYRVSTQRGVCRSVRHKIETDKMIHTQGRANIIHLPHTHLFFFFLIGWGIWVPVWGRGGPLKIVSKKR